MQKIVVLSLLGLIAAHSPKPVKQADCAVDAGEAVSDATDSALFIWAASKRCGKVGMKVKCEVDVASAVKSVNSMINVILKAVKKCHGLHTHNRDCALKASGLTEHTAALAAAAGMAVQKCPTMFGQGTAPPAMGAMAGPVMCTVDLKNTAKHLFHATKLLTKTHGECKHSHHACTVNALDVAGSFAGMGSWLAGSVGHCRRTAALAGAAAAKADTRTSLCVQAASALVEQTLKVAQDGVELSKLCSESSSSRRRKSDDWSENAGPNGIVGDDDDWNDDDEAWGSNSDIDAKAKTNDEVPVVQGLIQMPRLFEEDGMLGGTSGNLVLGALLPVTAVLSFVGGRYYATQRARTEQVREFLSDVEE